jgi:hypothetical protein
VSKYDGLLPQSTITNEIGCWLLRVGDKVTFRENTTVKGGPTLTTGTIFETPKPARHGVVTHLKVLRPDREGFLTRELIALRNVVGVESAVDEAESKSV